MKFCVLASGSKGNCTYIETANHRILIDMGTTAMHIENKLRRIRVEPSSIDAIFITHGHTDHISGLAVFHKRYNTPVYLTEKMKVEGKIRIDNIINIKGPVTLDELTVTPLKTSHDVYSHGYILEDDKSSLVYITDTGYIHDKYYDELRNRNAYIFESNHDIEKLMNNPRYPYPLKNRILSSKGHLSNHDSSTYLCKFIGDNTKYVVLAHLSEENNEPDLAITTLRDTLDEYEINFSNIIAASQEEETEMLEV
jgi:phosphoribosyl 1,2-cyclic phosphodiesterase